jgi:hypothetical protein
MATTSHWRWQDAAVLMRAPWSCAILIISVLLVKDRSSCCCSLCLSDCLSGCLGYLMRCYLCCNNVGLMCLGIGCCCSSNSYSLASRGGGHLLRNEVRL